MASKSRSRSIVIEFELNNNFGCRTHLYVTIHRVHSKTDRQTDTSAVAYTTGWLKTAVTVSHIYQIIASGLAYLFTSAEMNTVGPSRMTSSAISRFFDRNGPPARKPVGLGFYKKKAVMSPGNRSQPL